MTTFPGLIDLQVNGAHGHDLTSEPESIWDVAAVLPQYGVTAFLPTIVSSHPDVVDTARAVLAAGPPAGWTGAAPLGLHLEGPMLAPARRGAHSPAWLRPPAACEVDDWSPENGVTMVTLAPELPGAIPMIESLVRRGVVVSIGHSEASSVDVAAAIAAGATCVTHLGNAMPPMTSREPGIVGATLGGGSLVAGVIVDGEHLDPLFVRTAWTSLFPDRFLSVSDTTAALGLPPGQARLGDLSVFVSQGSVRLPDGTLAGSASSLLACLRTLVGVVGCTVGHAVRTASDVPAALLQLPPRDDQIVLTEDLDLVATVIGGDVVYGGL